MPSHPAMISLRSNPPRPGWTAIPVDIQVTKEPEQGLIRTVIDEEVPNLMTDFIVGPGKNTKAQQEMQDGTIRTIESRLKQLKLYFIQYNKQTKTWTPLPQDKSYDIIKTRIKNRKKSRAGGDTTTSAVPAKRAQTMTSTAITTTETTTATTTTTVLEDPTPPRDRTSLPSSQTLSMGSMENDIPDRATSPSTVPSSAPDAYGQPATDGLPTTSPLPSDTIPTTATTKCDDEDVDNKQRIIDYLEKKLALYEEKLSGASIQYEAKLTEVTYQRNSYEVKLMEVAEERNACKEQLSVTESKLLEVSKQRDKMEAQLSQVTDQKDAFEEKRSVSVSTVTDQRDAIEKKLNSIETRDERSQFKDISSANIVSVLAPTNLLMQMSKKDQASVAK